MDLNISQQFENMIGIVLQWLPKLIGALLILIIGGIVAGIVKRIITKLLRAAKFDHLLEVSPIGDILQRVTNSPARVAGGFVYWLVFLGAVSLAVAVLGIPALTAFVSAIYEYLPNVVSAIAIFLVAAGISTAIAGAATTLLGDTPTGKLMASILPTITMVIAVFMILDQLQIAPQIVTITYAGLVATMVLGIGLSVGLGGREIASDILSGAYEKGKEHTGQAKRDMRAGRERAQQRIDDVRQS